MWIRPRRRDGVLGDERDARRRRLTVHRRGRVHRDEPRDVRRALREWGIDSRVRTSIPVIGAVPRAARRAREIPDDALGRRVTERAPERDDDRRITATGANDVHGARCRHDEPVHDARDDVKYGGGFVRLRGDDESRSRGARARRGGADGDPLRRRSGAHPKRRRRVLRRRPRRDHVAHVRARGRIRSSRGFHVHGEDIHDVRLAASAGARRARVRRGKRNRVRRVESDAEPERPVREPRRRFRLGLSIYT